MTQPRWIELDGVVNMRDVGGLPTRDGGRLRERRLIRSDNLQDLTESDVAHVVDVLGVTDVVDLRTHDELDETGPGPLRRTAVAHHHHTFFRAVGGDLRDLMVLREEEQPVKDASYWSAHYRGYLEHRPDSVAGALGRVADARGAALVHCAAGKDRTGTVVALALSVAGVPDEEIVADYVLTAERLPRIIERLQGTGFYSRLRDRPMSEQEPVPEAITGLLDSVTERGGARAWLRDQGWSAEQVERLAARLRD